MRLITTILLFLSFLPPVFPQGELDEEDKIFYNNKKTFGFLLNSNGIGGGFRYAKRIDAFKKTTYEIDLAHIKHSKEFKISSSSTQQNLNTFVYGKLHSLLTLRAGIGIQKELFRKEDKGGISIRYFYGLGPSIGLQKPVYYEIYIDSDQGTQEMKFESHISPGNIIRKAPFYVGGKEASVVPGIYAKFGFSFEFSKTDVMYNSIEVGVIADAYYKKIPIMANELNHWIYPAFFLSYRFGRIIDSQFKQKRNKIDEVLTN